jgi:hypothetical protein
VINNYLKVIDPLGKMKRLITFDDTDVTSTANAVALARVDCPPKGRIIAWREAHGLHVDGITGQSERVR